MVTIWERRRARFFALDRARLTVSESNSRYRFELRGRTPVGERAIVLDLISEDVPEDLAAYWADRVAPDIVRELWRAKLGLPERAQERDIVEAAVHVGRGMRDFSHAIDRMTAYLYELARK